ncbi:MAG: putative sugar nucleotidyl transferase [Chitinophagaceae bacterium]
MNLVENDIIKKQLFPFTLTRSVADIRIGILTIREKWNLVNLQVSQDIPSNLLPSTDLLSSLSAGDTLTSTSKGVFITHPWHIFQYNDFAIREDFVLLTTGRISGSISKTNHVISPENVFLEEGASVEYVTLNASKGPIYVGKNAVIMEGSIIRGPFALCEGAIVKMGTMIYGATTLGPFSVGGGEIKNSVIFGYSNKAHHGYLGDSVIGEWCNLGAGTSNSNLKNNAGEIKIWNPTTDDFLEAGTKCGLLMGDFSRSAINTSFNTGTVTGICCNIFCQGLTNSYIPNFSWGGYEPELYDFDKAIRDINNWKKLKNHFLSEEEVGKLKDIYNNHNQ